MIIYLSLFLYPESFYPNKTLCETIRKNRRELPELSQPLERNIQYFQSDGIARLNYPPKNNRNIVLLLSFHHKHFNVHKEKPEMI